MILSIIAIIFKRYREQMTPNEPMSTTKRLAFSMLIRVQLCKYLFFLVQKDLHLERSAVEARLGCSHNNTGSSFLVASGFLPLGFA